MRYLILSDVHANWQALEAVLRDAHGDYGEVLCCGDLVGYGADPNAVVEWARSHVKAVVRGNHDKACAGLEDLEWFNSVARAAAIWTGRTLTPENLDYLRNLPQGPLAMGSFQLLHGSPLDEDDYLVTRFDAAHMTAYLEKHISFFGHTHVQGGFLCHRNGVKSIEKPKRDVARKAVELERDVLYLVNPGSVGQPRDGDPRAAYLIYSPEDRFLEYRRVNYDVATAQSKIIAAGLPDVLAHRLAMGS